MSLQSESLSSEDSPVINCLWDQCNIRKINFSPETWLQPILGDLQSWLLLRVELWLSQVPWSMIIIMTIIIIIVINTCKPSNPSSQRMWTVWPDLLSCLHMVLLSTNQRSVLICINQSRVSIFTCQDQLPDLSFLLFSLQQENASVLTLLKWWVKMTKLLSSNQI